MYHLKINITLSLRLTGEGERIMNENCTLNIPIIPCDAWEYNGNKVDGSDYSEIQQNLKRRKYFCIEFVKP